MHDKKIAKILAVSLSLLMTAVSLPVSTDVLAADSAFTDNGETVPPEEVMSEIPDFDDSAEFFDITDGNEKNIGVGAKEDFSAPDEENILTEEILAAGVGNATVATEGLDFTTDEGSEKALKLLQNGDTSRASWVKKADEEGNNVLALNNVNFVTDFAGTALFLPEKTIIQLTGDNKIFNVCGDGHGELIYGIKAQESLKISGDGSLSVKAKEYGIYCNASLTVDTSGQLKGTAEKDYGIYAYRNITQNSGSIYANGGKSGVYVQNKYYIEGGELYATGNTEGVHLISLSLGENISKGSESYNDDNPQGECTYNGTEYTFKMNNNAVAKTVKIGIVPDAPIIQEPVAGNGTVAIRWSEPNTGGRPITGYKVACSDTNTVPVEENSWVDVEPTITNYLFDGLTNDKTYYFWVKAFNQNGGSPPSAPASMMPQKTIEDMRDKEWATSGDILTISTAGQMAQFNYLSNSSVLEDIQQIAGKSIVLANDIDISSITWKGIKLPKNTVFDGNGYQITYTMTAVPDVYNGLFSISDSGSVIRNLRVEGSICVDRIVGQYVGGLIGASQGSLENCMVDVTLKASSMAPRKTSNGNMSSCVGVLAGYAQGNVSGCTTAGSISSNSISGTAVGGGIGQAAGCEIISCINASNITASSISGSYCGGIAAYITSTTISSCINASNISVSSMNSAYCGGIAGIIQSSVILNCLNKGISSVPNGLGYIGGLIGYLNNTTLSNCLNIGQVSGRNASALVSLGGDRGTYINTYALVGTAASLGNGIAEETGKAEFISPDKSNTPEFADTINAFQNPRKWFIQQNDYPTVAAGKTQVTISGISIKDRPYTKNPVLIEGSPEAAILDGETTSVNNYLYIWQQKGADGNYSTITQAPVDAGKYRLVIVAEDAKYIGQEEIEFTISKAEITVKADDKVMTQGDKLPDFTVSYTGIDDDDLQNIFKTKASATCFTDGKSNGSFDITLSTEAVLKDEYTTNYTISSQQKGTLTVTVPHTHSFSAEWKNDSINHWHECSCGAKTDLTAHIMTNGICSVCSYSEQYPSGSTLDRDNNIVTPGGTVIKPDGTIILPDEEHTTLVPGKDGSKPSIDKAGNVTDINGTQIKTDGEIILPGSDKDEKDDIIVSPGTANKPPHYHPEDGSVTLEEGNTVTYPNGIVQKPEAGSFINQEGTITTPDGSKITADGVIHRADGAEISHEGVLLRPATTIIKDVKISGNKASVILKDKAYGASGYDYVISQNKNCIIDKDYLVVNKNVLNTVSQFQYVQKGTYYVYCHAWTRGSDGKKTFGQWSEGVQIKITALTPKTPKVSSVVKGKGNTITVNVSGITGANGFDIILGKQTKKVNGEKRPVDYGSYVKKNQNTTTVTFKNLKKGTYYIAIHTYNKDENNKKVFSKWSNIQKITIK